MLVTLITGGGTEIGQSIVMEFAHLDMRTKVFGAVVDTNMKGTSLCCQEAYTQYMLDHGESIISITLGNRYRFVGTSHSAATRAGIENIRTMLRNEWIESDV